MGRPLRVLLCSLLALAALSLVAAAAAGAATKFVTLDGFNAPGPAKYDKVQVLEQGPINADHVLVLEPGTSASAAYFRLIAGDLVKALPGWQVWSVERRENLLEDHSRANQAKAGKISAKQLFDYYLGWIGNPNPPAQHFTPVPDADVPFARQWGMNVAIQDLRRVIAAARRGGRTVVLGGHSLGGSITTAYATWDFGGHAGAEDLAGLVFIDGAGGGRVVPTKAQAEQSLADLEQSSPWLDLVRNGLPWSAGVFNIVGSTASLKEPNSLSVFDGWPFLPPDLRPPQPASNRGGYGRAFDTATSPDSLALIQVHIGHFAESGDPRGWVNGELGTVERVATMFSGISFRGHDGTAWYHPLRLSIDASALDNGNRNPAQRVFGDCAFHGDDVHVPIYAFETSLGAGRVLKATRELASQSHVPPRNRVLIDRSKSYAHVDPLAASPDKNAFLKTVVPFLRRIG
jgi:hypothetical protein